MEVAVQNKLKVPKLRFGEFEDGLTNGRLGDFCEFTQGVQIPFDQQVTEPKEGYVRYLYIRDFFTDNFSCYVKDNHPHKIIRDDEIMMVNTGNTAGYAYTGSVGVLSNNCFKISFDSERINTTYLFLNLTSERTQGAIKSFFNYGGQPHLGHKNIAKVNFSFPTLPEQKKIADFLSAVDEKLQQFNRKKELLETYKKGVMQKLFAQELRFKQADGTSYADWEEKRLGELASRKKEKNRDNSVAFVLTNSATQGIISQSDYFDRDIANANNLEGYYLVEKDDFVYNPRISVHAPVGPIKRNKLTKGVMSPLYSVFRFKAGPLEYFEFFFETVIWHKYMNSVANFGARHDRMAITNEDLLKMPVPMPCKEEQQKIADFLSSLDKKIAGVNAQIEKTQQFKKGLLQEMFV